MAEVPRLNGMIRAWEQGRPRIAVVPSRKRNGRSRSKSARRPSMPSFLRWSTTRGIRMPFRTLCSIC